MPVAAIESLVELIKHSKGKFFIAKDEAALTVHQSQMC